MMHELFESLDGPKTDEQCYVEAWLWDRLGEHRVAQAIRDGLAREQTVRSH